jgi:hypothetical protein
VRTAAALLVLLSLARAEAQDDVRVRSEVDARRIGAEDTVELTVTLEGQARLASEITVPPLTNLRVASGPSVSTQISFVNGAMTQSRAYSWILQPLAVGPARVGALTVRLQDGERTAPAIPIEVVPGSARPARGSARGRVIDPWARMFGGDPLAGARQAAMEPAKMVAVVEASRDRVYVGEPIVVTYILYTQTSVSDLQFVQAPEYPGFWSEELPKPDAPPGGEPAELGGERYRRFPFLRRLLFPTRAGTLDIPATTLRMAVPGGMFEPPVAVQRSTKPITVVAQAVPEEPGWSGAVGQFALGAELDRSAVRLGEAATLRVTVSGRGNLKWVERAPAVSVSGARAYPPQVKDAIRADVAGLEGSRTWDYVIVPETAGTLQVPAVEFTWFDPAAGRMTRASSTPLTLEVSPGAPSGAAPAVPGPAARDRGGLALRSDLDSGFPGPPRLGGRTVALVLLAALGAHLLLAAGFGIADQRAARQGHAPRGTVRAAVHELHRAARGDMSKEAAAALIEKALHETFGDVDVGAPATERDRVAAELLQQVQFIRYAPQLGDYTEQIKDVARRAEEAVRRWA